MGEARRRGTREERIRQAIAECRADDGNQHVQDGVMDVFVVVEHQVGDRWAWSYVKDAPFEVRKRAAEIAQACQVEVEQRLQRALQLMLGYLPPLPSARQYLTQNLVPIQVGSDGNGAGGIASMKRIYKWNGNRLLEVYPLELKLDGSRISVRQFVYGTADKPEARGTNFLHEERLS